MYSWRLLKQGLDWDWTGQYTVLYTPGRDSHRSVQYCILASPSPVQAQSSPSPVLVLVTTYPAPQTPLSSPPNASIQPPKHLYSAPPNTSIQPPKRLYSAPQTPLFSPPNTSIQPPKCLYSASQTSLFIPPNLPKPIYPSPINTSPLKNKPTTPTHLLCAKIPPHSPPQLRLHRTMEGGELYPQHAF